MQASAPTQVIVTASESTLRLSWVAVPGATTYYVYRSTAPNQEGQQIYSSTASASYQDNNTYNGTRYYYKITALNATGEGPRSAEVSGTPNSTPLAAPVLSFTLTSGIPTLNWTGIAGAKTYFVSKSDTVTGTQTVFFGLTTTTYTDKAVVAGRTYHYTVSPIGPDGLGSNSNGVDVTAGVPNLGAPTQVIVTASESTLRLSWVAVPGATTYYVYRSTAPNQEGQQIYSSTASASYQDNNTYNGTRYYYKITALNAASEGPRSAEVSGTPNSTQAEAPDLQGTIVSNLPTLMWNTIPRATSYIVNRVDLSGSNSKILFTGNVNKFIDHTAYSGLSYIYTVSAVTQDSLGQPSQAVALTAGAGSIIQPSLFSITPSSNSITLTWNAINGALAYYIYRGNTPGEEGTVPIGIVTGGITSYTDNVSDISADYFYVVTAVNNTGESSRKNEISTQTITSLPASYLSVTSAHIIAPQASGIVCDNSYNMPISQQTHLFFNIPKYPSAVVTGVSIVNENTGTTRDINGDRNVGWVLPGTGNGLIYYYPPREFNYIQQPKQLSDITVNATRDVIVNVYFHTADGKNYIIADKHITLARPAVILVHGINGNPDDWSTFFDNSVPGGITSARFPFTTVDHSTMSKGNGPVEMAAFRLESTIDSTLKSIQRGKVIYASSTTSHLDGISFNDYSGKYLETTHVDVVAHSYGGVITRWYIAADTTNASDPYGPSRWYRRDYHIPPFTLPVYGHDIRKVFTLGSMWRGVPLINYVNEAYFGPSSTGVSLANAKSGRSGTIAELIGLLSLKVPTGVPSMEVMAIDSPWQRYLIYHSPTGGTSSLPSPFNSLIQYGSVAGDRDEYLPWYDVLTSKEPYQAINDAQQPSVFTGLSAEYAAGKTRNYSDGLVPVWSSAIPGSYKIAPAFHSDFPLAAKHSYMDDLDTHQYLLQWLNDEALPTGDYLNEEWGLPKCNENSIYSVDNSIAWRFTPGLMGPISPDLQGYWYRQIDGAGRIDPEYLHPQPGTIIAVMK